MYVLNQYPLFKQFYLWFCFHCYIFIFWLSSSETLQVLMFVLRWVDIFLMFAAWLKFFCFCHGSSAWKKQPQIFGLIPKCWKSRLLFVCFSVKISFTAQPIHFSNLGNRFLDDFRLFLPLFFPFEQCPKMLGAELLVTYNSILDNCTFATIKNCK